MSCLDSKLGYFLVLVWMAEQRQMETIRRPGPGLKDDLCKQFDFHKASIKEKGGLDSRPTIHKLCQTYLKMDHYKFAMF